MKTLIILLLPLTFLLFTCTKEVHIDIPGYQEKVVVDGFIETNSPPIVLLSKTHNIYSPTDLDAYLNGFISGAVVVVSDGTNTVTLDEICTDNLPAGTEEMAAAMFGVPVEMLDSLHLCAYTTFDTAIWGQVGKTYHLTVSYEGKTYESSTELLPATPLNNTYWKPNETYTDRGYLWFDLSDNVLTYDAYKCEMKYINESVYSKPYSPITDDEYFNGKTFEFSYENPMTCNDESIAEDYRCYYKQNDTIVVKFSKMDKTVYNCLTKQQMQLYSAGNPFATPTNIPTNITNGALGLWAAYSPWYDTVICVQ